MRQVVSALQTQLPRPGGDDGRAGLSMVHTTIMRWVRRYAPEFERRWNQFARPAGASWRIDEVHGAAPDIRMQHRSFERNPA